MPDPWAWLGRPVLLAIDSLTPLFSNEAFAPTLAMVMLGAAVLIGLWGLYNSSGRVRACGRRITALRKALGSSTDRTDRRAAFAQAFGDVAAVMRRPARRTELVHAWDEFSESIVDETETPIRNTVRPSTFFGKSLPPPRWLNFWSNLFVGIGLVLTFLGIVVALHITGDKLHAGGNPRDMQNALSGLISITAFKFTTSIAGVLGSLILRVFERIIAVRQDNAVHRLNELLEQGLLYVSPQSLAVAQLSEVREQSTQLKKFNTDLALSIGESVGQQFQAAVQPIAVALDSIKGQIADVQGQSLAALTTGMAATIEGAASGELRALGQTLETLRADLDGLSGKLQGGGAEAARQIEAAGETFARAASDIRGAFAELAGHVEGLGGKLAAETEEASRRSSERLDALLAAFDTASSRSAAASEQSVAALSAAGASAAANLNTALGATVAKAGEEAEGSLRTAAQRFGETFETQRQAFSGTLGDAATQIDKLRAGLAEIEQALGGHARSLTVAAEGTRSAASALDDAATGMASAAQPVLKLTQSLIDATDDVGEGAEAFTQASAAALRQTETLARELTRNQEILSAAWNAHKDRFESVDKDLAKAVEQIGSAFERNGRDVTKFVGDMDKEMQKVVDRLAEQLMPLTDYAEALEAFVSKIAKGR